MHKWRWRFLAVWCVAFTLLVAWALAAQNHDRRSTDRRFCSVSSAFISSNVALRNAQNAASVTSIGERQRLIMTEQRLVHSFATTATPLRAAIIAYFKAEIALNESANTSAVETLNAADRAVKQWMRLREDLRCAT